MARLCAVNLQRETPMSDLPQPDASLFGDIAPKFAQLIDEVLFADLWQRPALSPRERSLVTVAALVARIQWSIGKDHCPTLPSTADAPNSVTTNTATAA